MKKTAEERFWEKVDKQEDGLRCWYWTGGRQGRGFGVFNVGGRTVAAHRYAWELLRGEILGQVRQVCGNKLCVNPDHMADCVPTPPQGERYEEQWKAFYRRHKIDMASCPEKEELDKWWRWHSFEKARHAFLVDITMRGAAFPRRKTYTPDIDMDDPRIVKGEHCWIWKGGKVYPSARQRVWVKYHGEWDLDEGQRRPQIWASCKTDGCVRPDHLYIYGSGEESLVLGDAMAEGLKGGNDEDYT